MTGKVPRTEGLDEDAVVAEWDVPKRVLSKSYETRVPLW